MDNQNQNNFMDSRTLIAIVLVGVIFFGWQNYLKKKYGNQPAPTAVTEQATNNGAPATAAMTSGQPTAATTSSVPQATSASAPVEERLVHFENDQLAFDVSSRGMGLRNLVLKDQKDRAHNPMKLGQSEQSSLYKLGLPGINEDLNFQITQKAANEFEGVAQFGDSTIRRVLNYNSETGAIENTVTVDKVGNQFPGLVISIPEKSIEASSESFLAPSLERQEFIVVHGDNKEERFRVAQNSEKVEKSFSTVSLLGVGSQYFTSSIVDKSEVIPEARIVGGAGATEIQAQMIYRPTNGKDSMELKWLSYSGGKSMSNLEKIDPLLSRVVDLGFFTTIGKVLLKTLQWFHTAVGNWGLSIVLLTLLVRILVLPLNISTFRSTKKMVKLQPKIAALRERFKDDPQALNREMMTVWKENKVNPLGGCLPMLLQLPIFFALYRVLGESIELYQAPFYGWIHDLSLKDPFYVLPVLMAVCMFVQQKMTPTTMDPTQAKVMQFLPLIFAFMMMSLPSGLTLYIFINTLSGIILQQLFMRDKSSAVSTKAAKA